MSEQFSNNLTWTQAGVLAVKQLQPFVAYATKGCMANSYPSGDMLAG